MTLLAEVVACLEHEGSQHAMIGATAMAALGAGRSTQDLDILTNDRTVLRSARWQRLGESGATIEIRHGDIQDPLVGVVRVSRAGERPVDVIVGEGAWQDRILEEASVRQISDVEVPVVNEVGLVLLKLYAGGPQDRWDIEQLLLQTADRTQLERSIGERVSELPARCSRLWERMIESSNDVVDE